MNRLLIELAGQICTNTIVTTPFFGHYNRAICVGYPFVFITHARTFWFHANMKRSSLPPVALGKGDVGCMDFIAFETRGGPSSHIRKSIASHNSLPLLLDLYSPSDILFREFQPRVGRLVRNMLVDTAFHTKPLWTSPLLWRKSAPQWDSPGKRGKSGESGESGEISDISNIGGIEKLEMGKNEQTCQNW